jgi:hypothetical protein
VPYRLKDRLNICGAVNVVPFRDWPDCKFS